MTSMPRVRAMIAAPLLALAGLLAAAAPARAQELRTVDIARQLDDTLPLQVFVDYAAGKVVVHGTTDPLLYQLQLVYDPRRSEPMYRFDEASRLLRLGVQKRSGSGDGSSEGQLRLDLSTVVPMDLRLDVGAAGADLDLGGLRLQRLAVQNGASDAVVHFDTPNRAPMQLMELEVGAATLRARGLANARARELRVNVGVGTADLDFGGEWTTDLDVQLEVALGKATLRVPEDVGIRIDLSRFLASFDRSDFVKRDGAWYSTNWDTATHRMRVRTRAVLGELQVERGAE